MGRNLTLAQAEAPAEFSKDGDKERRSHLGPDLGRPLVIAPHQFKSLPLNFYELQASGHHAGNFRSALGRVYALKGSKCYKPGSLFSPPPRVQQQLVPLRGA